MTTAAPPVLWYTRCPVPTASGLAWSQGWLDDYYQSQGVTLGLLQDAPLEIARHHYDHALPGLLREGGNVPAILARASGSPTRLIGLTWIDERQTIVTRPDSGISSPEALVGRRIAIPDWAQERHASHHRAMALAGFTAALSLAGRGLDAVSVHTVPVGQTIPPGRLRGGRASGGWVALTAVADGQADAAYVKGSDGLAAARALGLVSAIDLDQTPTRSARVNNGTPRPLTVHESLLQSRPEWVIAFLAASLRAAAWASAHPDEVRAVLLREAGGDGEAVAAAYGQGFETGFAPSLTAERLALLNQQVEFLVQQGFLDHAIDITPWAAPEVLAAAQAQANVQAKPQANPVPA